MVQNNDTIEISNNVFASNSRGGIHMYLTDKQATVNIVNNNISGNINGSEAVYIVDIGNDASSKLLMAGNYLNLNDIVFPHDMVVIKNIAAIIKENVFYDNTARYTMSWVGVSKESITSIITRNIFFLNKGYFHTLLLASNGREIINENYFSNPSNDFELSTLPSLFPHIVVNASNNWWGNIDPEIIMRRIKDKRRATDLPRVIYKPFLLSPTQISSTGKYSFTTVFTIRERWFRWIIIIKNVKQGKCLSILIWLSTLLTTKCIILPNSKSRQIWVNEILRKAYFNLLYNN